MNLFILNVDYIVHNFFFAIFCDVINQVDDVIYDVINKSDIDNLFNQDWL